MSWRSPVRQPTAWCAVVALLLMLLAAPVLGAPRIPGHPEGAEDDLAEMEWVWARGPEEGLVVDLSGTPDAALMPPEIAYRVHGDIAAIEGTFLLDTGRDNPQPVFNTGMRSFEIGFEPALGLSEGPPLQKIRIPALEWTRSELVREERSLRVAFEAAVPAPDAEGASPPENASAGAVAHITWSASFHRQASQQMYVDAVNDTEWALTFSPADAHVETHVEVDPSMLSEEGKERLPETRVVFRYLFDFGGSASGRNVTNDGGIGASGILLYRGDAASGLRFIHTRAFPVEVEVGAPTGRPVPGADIALLSPPLTANATVPLHRPDFNESRPAVSLRTEFGFMMDLPEPSGSPTPRGEDEEDAPMVPLPFLLGGLLLFASAVRRTEAAR